jgi:2',3'-cyclic-nucleotide 2'-phosphodiesterase (5'-nucleotidase family)
VAGAAFGVATLAGPVFAAADGKKTFTVLHTNDMHSAFIGLGPASDYTPFKPDDDKTRGWRIERPSVRSRGGRAVTAVGRQGEAAQA